MYSQLLAAMAEESEESDVETAISLLTMHTEQWGS